MVETVEFDMSEDTEKNGDGGERLDGKAEAVEEQSEYTDMSDFERFREQMAKRYSSTNLTAGGSELGNKRMSRRRSSLMIEYFRDNYMGIEASFTLTRYYSKTREDMILRLR